MKIAIVGPRLAAATTLAILFASSGIAASPPSSPTPAAAEDKLQSEFLFDLVLEAQMPTNLTTANGRPSDRTDFRWHIYRTSPQGHDRSSEW
jgi:hypothetical protein